MRMKSPLLVFGCLAVWVCASAAFAAGEKAPVPNVTIYPGDVIQDKMLTDGPPVESLGSDMIDARSKAIGKIARRTLFANKPISQSWLGDPRAVANGALVQLIYEQPFLSITTTGQALQAAGVGDAIRIRNLDSGIVVSGVVAPDGTVRIGG